MAQDNQDKFNPALKWFAAIGLAGFISSGCLWYLLPHDFHSSGNALVKPAAVPPASPSKSPPQPDLAPTDAFPSQPPPAEPSRPAEKVSACVIGDPELRDLFAANLLQSIAGKIVSGDCSAVEGPIVIVSGFASKLATDDPACKTVDGHLYEVIFSISRPGSHSDISRTVSVARCSSRIRKEDTALGREAKNQAVLQGIVSLRELLQHLSEN